MKEVFAEGINKSLDFAAESFAMLLTCASCYKLKPSGDQMFAEDNINW